MNAFSYLGLMIILAIFVFILSLIMAATKKMCEEIFVYLRLETLSDKMTSLSVSKFYLRVLVNTLRAALSLIILQIKHIIKRQNESITEVSRKMVIKVFVIFLGMLSLIKLSYLAFPRGGPLILLGHYLLPDCIHLLNLFNPGDYYFWDLLLLIFSLLVLCGMNCLFCHIQKNQIELIKYFRKNGHFRSYWRVLFWDFIFWILIFPPFAFFELFFGLLGIAACMETLKYPRIDDDLSRIWINFPYVKIGASYLLLLHLFTWTTIALIAGFNLILE